MTSTSQLLSGRNANLLLFTVTLLELIFLLRLFSSFTMVDWIYVAQHLLVLVISLARRRPVALDASLPSALAVAVAYTYPYAQVIYLHSVEGQVVWPSVGTALVILSAFLSMAALLSLGTQFGVRPALRGLTTFGPYRVVRNPMYLAYFIADIGYELQEWNVGAVLIMIAGWASLIYRIYAEERMLSLHADWRAYVRKVRYRLVPGLW